MLQSEKILKICASIENKFDVNELRFNGIQIWPLLRFTLMEFLQLCQPVSADVMDGKDVWAQLDDKINTAFENLPVPIDPLPDRDIEYFLSSSIVANKEQKPSGGNSETPLFLFFTRPDDHWRNTPGGFYAPNIDPWFEISAKQYRAIKIEMLSNSGLKSFVRRHMTQFLSSSNYRPDDEFDMAANPILDFLDVILEHIKSVFGMDPKKWVGSGENLLVDLRDTLRDGLISILASKFQFDEYFSHIQPKAIFVQCYYDRSTLGLIWAAKERGIATVDLQHGANGYYHYPYTHFSKMPDKGYDLLPDYFAVWGRRSANIISRWLPDKFAAHRAVIGGRFDLLQSEITDQEFGSLEKLHSIIRSRASRVILVALSPLTAMEHTLPLLISTALVAPPDWLWFIRPHPLNNSHNYSKGGFEYIEAELKAAGVPNYDCRLAAGLPLAAVLEISDHLFTGHSSVAMEAKALDIPTTFSHPWTKIWYPDWLDNRVSYFADTPDDIIASIEAGKDGLDGFGDDKTDVVVDRRYAEDLIDYLAL
jgi:hypothetical protein